MPDRSTVLRILRSDADRSVLNRAARILDKLDTRLEGQTFHRRASDPAAVAIVSLFHSTAADTERKLGQLQTIASDCTDDELSSAIARLVRAIMSCRRIVAMHLDTCEGRPDPGEARIARAQGAR